MPTQYTSKFLNRFWKKVNITDLFDCWLWNGSTVPGGYGQIRLGDKRVLSHRIAWEMTYGAIPEGMSTLHRCDTPACVNPAHLYIGTQKENMQDSIKRGRFKQRKYKWLVPAEVLQIRRLIVQGTYTQSTIAEWFGRDRSAITDIARRKTWKHLLP